MASTLRLLRDCTFVRRQAYVEFDLRGDDRGAAFSGFRHPFRLLHRTRLPRGLADASDCFLGQYHAHSVEQGGRVRDHLREGVEECILQLANGFLAHTANAELRRCVSPSCMGNERITADDRQRSWFCCGNGGRRGRALMTPALPRNSAGCFQVAVIIGL